MKTTDPVLDSGVGGILRKGIEMDDIKRTAAIKGEIAILEYEQEQILDKYLGEGVGQWHQVGHWECDTSPVGVCVYNPFKDSMLDNCIYCHEPHERK